jgi:GTP-binding protein LepA
MVYSGMFPVEVDKYDNLRDALAKMQLNDAALVYEPESSAALGLGFRCGFLGLLHMDIVQERLEREYNIELLLTAPTVSYRAILNNGDVLQVDSPHKLPDPNLFKEVQEPYVKMEVFTPVDYTGKVMEVAQGKRADFVGMDYLTEKRVSLKFDIPLAEVITDFFDQIKAKTSGYASLEYSVSGYRASNLVKLEIRINGEPAPPLTNIVFRDSAHQIGKALTRKLKETIPRQQFKVPIQAVIGNTPIASSVISAVRKDVLAKCYGGDISRKKKLLQKQAKGKKRMKAIGSVNVPQEAFMAVLKLNE